MSLHASIGNWIQNWATEIGAIGSIVLTTALVGLYYAQHRVLKDQLQRESDPEITIENIRLEYLPDMPVVYENFFVLTLSNIGNGEATNLSITIEPTLIDSDFGLESITRELNRKPIDGNDSTVLILSKGNHLQPQERDVEFVIESVAGLFWKEGAPSRGHFNLSKLPKAIVEAELGKGIRPEDYPDREVEEKKLYNVRLPDDDGVASVVYEELDVKGLPVEIEEITRTELSEDEIADIINSKLGTMFVRMKLTLNFETSTGDIDELEVLDRVFPSRYGISNTVLFESGYDTDSLRLQDIKKTAIKRNMYIKMAERQDDLD